MISLELFVQQFYIFQMIVCNIIGEERKNKLTTIITT